MKGRELRRRLGIRRWLVGGYACIEDEDRSFGRDELLCNSCQSRVLRRNSSQLNPDIPTFITQLVNYTLENSRVWCFETCIPGTRHIAETTKLQ